MSFDHCNGQHLNGNGAMQLIELVRWLVVYGFVCFSSARLATNDMTEIHHHAVARALPLPASQVGPESIGPPNPRFVKKRWCITSAARKGGRAAAVEVAVQEVHRPTVQGVKRLKKGFGPTGCHWIDSTFQSKPFS